MLEMLMGLMLDQASLDDLLVSGHDGGVYDVNLVLRLIRVFVAAEEGGVSLQRMKKVGRLIDTYLGEISPDQSLKVSKFLEGFKNPGPTTASTAITSRSPPPGPTSPAPRLSSTSASGWLTTSLEPDSPPS